MGFFLPIILLLLSFLCTLFLLNEEGWDQSGMQVRCLWGIQLGIIQWNSSLCQSKLPFVLPPGNSCNKLVVGCSTESKQCYPHFLATCIWILPGYCSGCPLPQLEVLQAWGEWMERWGKEKKQGWDFYLEVQWTGRVSSNPFKED